ncbi:MAG: polyprenyl synthetase family protein [Bacteroidota bacterium]
MFSIEKLQQSFEQSLATLNISGDPKELYEPINYILSLGGKRMRPVLLMAGCDLFGGQISKAILPALGIEIFHNFSLMHDDIMDNSPIRRSKPTVHVKWDANTAILSGDAMLVEAYNMMMQVDDDLLRPILSVFSSAATRVCEGQQMDMVFEKKIVSIDDYINMISLKTAVLLAASLKIGGMIARANNDDIDHLAEFGLNLGIAFQLQDDILDVYGDKSKFGKQVGGDIIANKKTYLLLKAFELADDQTRQSLNLWMEKKDFVAEEKVASITTIFNSLNIKELAEKEMQSFHEKAMESMRAINQADDRKVILISLADSLMKREI